MFAAALVEQLSHTGRILTFCVNYRLAPVAAPYFIMCRLTVERRRVDRMSVHARSTEHPEVGGAHGTTQFQG